MHSTHRELSTTCVGLLFQHLCRNSIHGCGTEQVWESLDFYCVTERKGGWRASAGTISSQPWKWPVRLNSTFLFNESEPNVRGTRPLQKYINTQICIDTSPCNYSPALSQAICPHMGAFRVLLFISVLSGNIMKTQVAVLDACSGHWQCRCYLVT